MKILNDSHLMPYQVEGRDRILKQDVLYLGDDPGLGKTAQVIRACANMNFSILERGVVIVCPASLRSNWRQEWVKWGGPDWCELHILSYQEAVKDCMGNEPAKGKQRIGLLSKVWGVVAFDEAHALKTAGGGTQRAKSGLIRNVWKEKTEDPDESDKYYRVEGIEATKTIMMSGTPILNKPVDIFPILRHLDPRTWSSKSKFELRYCDARVDEYGRWKADGHSNLEELKRKLVDSKILLRRLKKDVLTQLPAKRRQFVFIEGKKSQVSKCNSIIEAVMKASILDDCLEGMKSEVLDMEEYELLPHSHIAQIRRELGNAKVTPAIEYLIEQDKLNVLPNKLVIFAHHRDVIENICNSLNKTGIKSEMYYGGMNDTQKNQVVQNFQHGDTRVFVGSLIAAGVGLTLTAADTCIIIEPSYVPAENIQAEDRIHRIGAQNPVLIQYMTLDNSLDSRIMSSLVNKIEMIQQVMS